MPALAKRAAEVLKCAPLRFAAVVDLVHQSLFVSTTSCSPDFPATELEGPGTIERALHLRHDLPEMADKSALAAKD